MGKWGWRVSSSRCWEWMGWQQWLGRDGQVVLISLVDSLLNSPYSVNILSRCCWKDLRELCKKCSLLYKMLLLCLSCLESKINKSYKNTVATSTTHVIFQLLKQLICVFLFFVVEINYREGETTLWRVPKCCDKGCRLGSSCFLLWLNWMKMHHVVAKLISKINSLCSIHLLQPWHKATENFASGTIWKQSQSPNTFFGWF